jgi:hypothetical protein
MKNREEQLTWAKQRAHICVDVGGFADAVTGLRADLDENPLTKGVMSSDQARRGYKAVDAALGRGSQSLTNGSRTSKIRKQQKAADWLKRKQEHRASSLCLCRPRLEPR